MSKKTNFCFWPSKGGDEGSDIGIRDSSECHTGIEAVGMLRHSWLIFRQCTQGKDRLILC